MSVAVAEKRVLADLVPAVAGRALVRDVLLVVGAAAFVGASAQISIDVPGTPVPVTGQTFAVLLAGAALGPIRGLLGMIVYLAAGAAGMPWFADAEAGLTGPTVGYLIGFVAAAWVVGVLAARGADRTVLSTIGLMTVGSMVIFLFGVPGLMLSTEMDFATAVDKGMVPFLLGDVIKIGLSAGLLPGAWKLLGTTPPNADSK